MKTTAETTKTKKFEILFTEMYQDKITGEKVRLISAPTKPNGKYQIIEFAYMDNGFIKDPVWLSVEEFKEKFELVIY